MLFKRVYDHYTKPLRWNIGFIYNDLERLVEGDSYRIQIAKHNYKDRWFADPFILDVNKEFIYLLVEELNYEWGRGRISKLTVERKTNSVVQVDPILQLDSHLSFPAILRKGDEVFIYPENADGYGLALYKYEKSCNKCVFLKIISERPLADAIITDLLGVKEMYGTEKPTHNGNTLNRYVFSDDDSIQIANRFLFSSNIARNAGDWFQLKGKYYRPAQDCNERYGAAVILQEVIKNKDNLFFNDLRRIKSTSWKYILGCHTFNHYKGVTVVDVHGYVHPVLGWLLNKITPKKLLK